MAKRQPRPCFTYRGVTVWRNTEPGHRLRYSALGVGAADTQASMCRLIRDSLNP